MKAFQIDSKFIFKKEKSGSGLKISADKKFFYLLNSGRNAIREIIDFENIEKVYLCAFNCESVIEPFIEKNVEIIFFSIDKYFNIKENFVEKLKNKGKIAIYLQNYFCNYELDELKARLRKLENVTIIEDITHCLLDDRAFQYSDYYLGSIRKWAGTGEGGFIICDKALPPFKNNDKDIIKAIETASLMQLQYIKNRNDELKQNYRSKLEEAEELFRYKETQIIAEESKNIIDNTDFLYIKQKRIENFGYLVNKMRKIQFIELPFMSLNDNSTPLYLPFFAKCRDRLQRFLFDYDIYLPIIWPKFSAIEITDNDVNYIYDNILCIPVDQRYDFEDMDKIVAAIEQFLI